MSAARPPALLLVIPVLALLLSACGGPAGAPTAAPRAAESVKPTAAAPTKPAAAAPTTGPANSSAVSGAPAPAATTAPAASAGAPAQPAATPAADAPSQGQVAGAAGSLPDLGQRIIRTGRIELVVGNLTESLRSLTQIVVGAGGYIQSSNVKEQGGSLVAEAVLRMPVDKYDGVFQQLRDLSAPDKRPSESSESQDVTEEFADTEARITNLKATEAQLLRLLAKAEKMEDILVVQRELTGVREQIERLQGRLNVLDRRSSFSTISVMMRPQPEARKPSPPVLAAPALGLSGVGLRPTFSWQPSEGATSYALHVTTDIDTTFASPLLSEEKVVATSYEWPAGLAELRSGTAYRWRVRASNATGDGDWSAPRAFTTVPGWSPLRTVNGAWAASLLVVQQVIDGLILVAVFFWWLWPLVLVGGVLLVRRRRRPVPPASPAPATPAPPAAPPAG